MAGKHFELLDRAFLGDDGVQTDSPSHTGLPRERRIDRLYTIDERGGRHRTTLTDARLRRLWRWRPGRAANHAAEDASHTATSDAARNAALHTHCVGVGLRFFLNNLRFLRDDLGRNQTCFHHKWVLGVALYNFVWGGGGGGGGEGAAPQASWSAYPSAALPC